MSLKYKAGSRVQQVWEVYEKEGPDKAFEFGLTLELKDNTLKSWVRMWAKELGRNDKVSASVAGNVKPAADRPASKVVKAGVSGRPRVFDRWIPDRLGSLVVEGSEVSEIKWDDGLPLNSFVPNYHIMDAKTKQNYFGIIDIPKPKPRKVIERFAAANDEEEKPKRKKRK